MKTQVQLLPHQLAFRKSTCPLKVLIGGYGSGKSFCLALESIIHSILDPGLLHLIISPSYKMARHTILYSLKEVLKKVFNLRQGVDYTWKISEWTLHIHKWNGRITIASSDEPDSLAGSNCASVGLDEASLQSEDAYYAAHERCRHPDAKHLQVFVASTPDGLGWLYDICEGDKRPDTIEVFKARTADNFFLPPEYEKRLREQYDPILIEAYLNGNFVNLTGSTAYHGFKTENIYKGSYEYDPTLPLLVGMDFNYSPNTAILAQEVAGKVIAFKEYYLDNCDTDAKCERILTDYPEAHFKLYMDASANNRSAHGVGKSDLIIIQNSFKGFSHQIYVDGHNPKRIDRLASVNTKLANRSLQIDKSCKHLIEDFRKIPHDEYINGNIKNNLGHISDALGYLIYYKFPIRSSGNRFGMINKEL